MTEILTSLHGKEVGLDKDRYLTTPVGIKTPAIGFGASGSETLITATAAEINSLSASNAVTAASTAANLANNGTHTLSSSQVSYTLAPPSAGVRKWITSIADSSGTSRKVLAGSGVTFDSSNATMTSSANNQSVILVGLSTSRWAIMSNVGSMAFSA